MKNLLNEAQQKALKEAIAKGYPYPSDLESGCEFYPNEAYFDGETADGEHPNANTCDTCDKPAQYMTCPNEDATLYICEDCAHKYGLEPFVEGMADQDSGPVYIGRHEHGITLNGLEYVLDQDGNKRVMKEDLK